MSCATILRAGWPASRSRCAAPVESVQVGHGELAHGWHGTRRPAVAAACALLFDITGLFEITGPVEIAAVATELAVRCRRPARAARAAASWMR
jgi:hypothetical protein